jgi:NAD(P)-dependent dehydrogenase (short-subunit alcohol dehydrogenase family)
VDDLLRFDLRGRTALVTGASDGLGVAIAPAVVPAGSEVTLAPFLGPSRTLAHDVGRTAR